MPPGKPILSCIARDCWRVSQDSSMVTPRQKHSSLSCTEALLLVLGVWILTGAVTSLHLEVGGPGHSSNHFTILCWFLTYVNMNQSATDTREPPDPEPPSTSLRRLSLWVVPEHRLWVPCFKHWTLALAICFAYGNVHVKCYSRLSLYLTATFYPIKATFTFVYT